jgi:hypothetical protein
MSGCFAVVSLTRTCWGDRSWVSDYIGSKAGGWFRGIHDSSLVWWSWGDIGMSGLCRWVRRGVGWEDYVIGGRSDIEKAVVPIQGRLGDIGGCHGMYTIERDLMSSILNPDHVFVRGSLLAPCLRFGERRRTLGYKYSGIHARG